jgi:ABC-type nitrate/sulfonate/bicarbonate transport system permease component
MFTDIALPGALPLIVAGIKLGVGVALLVIVATEFIGAKSGLGTSFGPAGSCSRSRECTRA